MRAARSSFSVAIVAIATLAGCRHAATVAPSPRVASVSCPTGGALPEILPPEPAAETNAGDDDPESTISPCKSGSPEHAAAESALGAVGTRVGDLANDADAKALGAVKDELTALLETPCFALSQGDVRYGGLEFSSAVSMKSWWEDGGATWVEHYLRLDDTHWSMVPPSPRRALTAGKATKAHPLAPLLCPPDDAHPTGAIGAIRATSCGANTLGWVNRADRALTRRAAAQHTSWGGKTAEECAKEAATVAPEERYSTYRECLENVAPLRDALPLGRFKAPADGWFVIAMPQHSSCKELRAYDLSTGAAYLATECGGRYSAKVTTGRVPLPMLREAVWMILLAPVAESRVRVEATSYEVPKEIAIRRPSAMLMGLSGVSRCGMGGTLRSWSWMREKNGVLVGQASGILRWPSGCEDAEDHAAELLSVAEDSLEPGCTTVPPPKRMAWDSPGPAIFEHGQPAKLNEPLLENLRLALGAAKLPNLTCPKP